jgi:hypothetical protein
MCLVEIYKNDSNKSKFDSGGNKEKFEFWQCLPPFSSEPSVFSSVVEE